MCRRRARSILSCCRPPLPNLDSAHATDHPVRLSAVRHARRRSRRQHRPETSAQLRRLRAAGDADVHRPGTFGRDRQGRQGGAGERLRRTSHERARAGGRADPVRHRIQHQALHRDRPRAAGGGGQARVGRAGDRLPAVVRDVRSLRHPRAERARSAGPPERPRPRCGRPALVAPVHVRPQGSRPPAAIHSPGHLVPERLRLRQRAVHCCGRSDRGGVRPGLGGVRAEPDPGEGRDDPERCAPLRRGRRRQRRGDACGGGRHRSGHRPILKRQHQPRRRHHVGRGGHGQVDDRAARLGASRRRWPPLLAGDNLPTLARRHAHADRRRTRGTGSPPPPHGGLRARPWREGLPRTHAAPAHRRAPGLRLQGRDDPRAQARRRGAHQPGIGRRVRIHRLPGPRHLPRGEAARLPDCVPAPRAAGPGRAAGAGAAIIHQPGFDVGTLAAARAIRRNLPRRLVRRRGDRARGERARDPLQQDAVIGG